MFERLSGLLRGIGGRANSGQEQRQAARIITRPSETDIFTGMSAFQPELTNIQVFRTLRANIPIINAAIIKRQLLIGSYRFETFGNVALRDMLMEQDASIRVNDVSRGVSTWWTELMDSADETGCGFGELVPYLSGRDIYQLRTCDTENFRFAYDKTTDRYRIAVRDGHEYKPIPEPLEDRIFYLAFSQRGGNPRGYSLFWGLPFVSQIMLRIMKSWDTSAWRYADPLMLVVVQGGKEQTSQDLEQTVSDLAGQVTGVMVKRRMGQSADISTGMPEGGNVRIEFLGGGTTIDAMEVQSSSVMEQITSVTHIPPVLYGLQWATGTGGGAVTQGQIDILVSLINKQRERIADIVERVHWTRLNMIGQSGKKWKLIWNDVNLQDEVRTAQARKMNAEAEAKEVEVLLSLVEGGYMELAEAEDRLRERGLLKGKATDYFKKRLQARLVRDIMYQ